VFLDISYLLATVVCHEVALVTPSQFASVVKSFLGKKKHRQLPRGSSQVDSAIPASKRGGFAEQERQERSCLQAPSTYYIQEYFYGSVLRRFDMPLITTRGRTQFNSSIYPDVRNASIHLPPTSSTAEHELARLLTSLCRAWRIG
jgi:hypothetical protein